MKGNLSKKKGFLKQLDEDDLKSISDTLEVRFDERLTDAENSVLDITQTTIPKLKSDLNKYTDDMVDKAYKGIEDLETTVKGKEDVSNKIMVADDDGTYWSAAMTDMKTYQTIKEHIVQDLNEPREDRIPSVKAVSEAVKGIKPDIDLSNYFTKNETTRMIDVAISNVYGAIESEVKIINKEKENVSNKANIISNNGSNSEKYPSTKAVYEYGQGIVQASETYTEAYVAQEIGNIETALEEIIEKYGLGGDAS
ncbi:MAG: hypothetical protein U0L72_08525 [Acutalibacteraceae bacterium]|nr:hypothetical protein [Acutalibacteraceae bacterium]